MSDKNLGLRTVFMDPEIDDKLRDLAYAGRRSKNDLVRMYIKMGMEAERLGATLGNPVVRSSAKVSATAQKTGLKARVARTKPELIKPTKSATRAMGAKRGPAGSKAALKVSHSFIDSRH